MNGTSITAVSGPGIPIQVFNGGLVNGSRELHFRDFAAGVQFQLSLVGTIALALITMPPTVPELTIQTCHGYWLPAA